MKKLPKYQKIQLVPEMKGYEIPSAYGMYANEKYIATVGGQYAFTQPSVILDELQQVVKKMGLNTPIETRVYRGGARVEFYIPLETFEIKTDKIVGDPVEKGIRFISGYDGKVSHLFDFYITRLACTNGMTRRDVIKGYKFRHTENHVQRLELMYKKVAKALESQVELEQSFQRLANTPFLFKGAEQFAHNVFGWSAEDVPQSTRKENMVATMVASIEREMNNIGENAWGLLNGVTWYTNHEVVKDDQREYLTFGGGEKLNSRAMALLF